MRRREFIAGLGGAAAASSLPVSVLAQQPLPVIGFLSSTSEAVSAGPVAGFRQGLEEAGLLNGRDVTLKFLWSDGAYDRLPALTTELVNAPVAVIVGSGLPATLAAKAATTSIPIVFAMGADPVTFGVVSSFNRPTGNITGVFQFYGALGSKRLEILRELVPGAALIAVISNPKNPNAKDHLHEVETAAHAIGQRIEVFHPSSDDEIDAAFAAIAQHKAKAILVTDDPFFTARRRQFVALAARYALPTIHYAREFPAEGGLLSYGSSIRENYRLAGGYVARILKGAKPSELPVLQPSKFELVINTRTAKALGLEIPPTLLARADDIIE